MGEHLRPLYNALWQQVTWLHKKWGEYITLFGTRPSRIALLNKAAPSFFLIVQDTLWEDILLHVARLTDSPKSAGKPNLSVRSLPESIYHIETRKKVEDLIEKALIASEFCRDWRNRRIAHRDLHLALSLVTEPLQPASRVKVSEALVALSDILNAISSHYQDSTTMFEFDNRAHGSMSLLCVLDDGLKAAAVRSERRKSGHFDPKDYVPRDL